MKQHRPFGKADATYMLVTATKELIEYAEARADWYRDEADAFSEANEWNLESDETRHVEELHKTEAAIRECILRAGAAIAELDRCISILTARRPKPGSLPVAS